MIHIIFERNEPFHFSFDRDAQIEAILKIGLVKRICTDFLSEMCPHPNHSSQIYWREIPIVKISCYRVQCVFKILSNKQDILFRLIQPVIQHTNVRYIALLVDLSLPGWTNHQELIMVLNRAGKMLLIPTETALSPLDFYKIKKYWKIQVNKCLKLKDTLKLLDIIAPESFPQNDFRISIQ
ncbi:MAG: hypothetical protein JSW11_19265 [Candidatus Heimdallarchaeota archaeon]|nr:MAG: hypothetical protein JSW11_19265 [Candidatus Heimdallarchaeota archaeon]